MLKNLSNDLKFKFSVAAVIAINIALQIAACVYAGGTLN